MFNQTAVIQTLLGQLALERERYEKLVTAVLAMQRDGFTRPPDQLTPALDDLAPVVLDALSEVPDAARDRVRVWAWEQARQSVDPELIAAQIRNGA